MTACERLPLLRLDISVNRVFRLLGAALLLVGILAASVRPTPPPDAGRVRESSRMVRAGCAIQQRPAGEAEPHHRQPGRRGNGARLAGVPGFLPSATRTTGEAGLALLVSLLLIGAVLIASTRQR